MDALIRRFRNVLNQEKESVKNHICQQEMDLTSYRFHQGKLVELERIEDFFEEILATLNKDEDKK
jgi:hypothetical protein